ncbi:MAG: AMP-binding protein [Nitriliruptoraceae bacterium]
MAARDDEDGWQVPTPSDAAEAADLLVAEGSLTRRWARQWAARASWPQLVDVDDRIVSSAELEARSRRAASMLLGSGLRPGDRVVLSATTSASLVVAYLALLRAGLVVVPINTGARPAEIARIVADARPAAAVVDDRERAGWVEDAAEGPLLVSGVELDLPSRAEGPLDAAGSRDPALLIYTSGTTGRPKGVALSHGNLLAGARAVEMAWDWTGDDRLLLALPLFHVHGLGVGLNGALSAGAGVALRPGFDVADVADRLAGGGHSMFFGVPAMYQRLAEQDRAGALRGLRVSVSGSAPLPVSLAEHVRKVAGELPLERYGMSETVMLTSNPLVGERRAGSVGWPLPGVRLRLAEGGGVEVRGPNVIEGYWQQPDANREAFTEDGWFRTGDVGRIDDDGRLWLLGRHKELIITGGYNVHPREVEEVLLGCPGVREVAVVGRPSERWGEEVTAFVVGDDDVTEETILAFGAERLTRYKVPKRVVFVDAMPVNAMGKVVRSELR